VVVTMVVAENAAAAMAPQRNARAIIVLLPGKLLACPQPYPGGRLLAENVSRDGYPSATVATGIGAAHAPARNRTASTASDYL
jgi:hypothetical protein